MSGSGEAKLIESLTWSNRSYNLAEFLREYSLPQLVRVVQGYDGGRDSTCLGADEVLMLHTLRSAPVLAAQDNQGQAITIPVDCPHELQVLPKLEDCRSTICGVEELIILFPKATFLQVVKCDTENKCESIKEGDYFEILSVDKKNKKIKIKHQTGGQTAILSSMCNVLFTPLLDWRSHRINDLKSKFALPARVRFLHAKGEGTPNTEREKQRLVTSETDLTIVEETTDDLIVATTAGKENESKFCYEIPKDLQLRVQGLEQNEAENKKIITTFDKRFDVSNLPEAQQLSLFKRRDSILEYNFESMKHLFHSIPGLNTANAVKSAEVEKERQLEGSISPPLPPRRSRPPSFRTGPRRHPVKPKGFETAQEDNGTTPEKEEILDAYQERKPRSHSEPPYHSETLKTTSLTKTRPEVPKRVTSLKPLTDRTSSNPGLPTTAVTYSDVENVEYLAPFEIIKPQNQRSVHITTQNSSDDVGAGCDDSIYEDIDWFDISQGSTYENLAKVPQDLSCLSVKGVARVLNSLCMECYVEKFGHEMIDGALLKKLRKRDLESLGMNTFYATKLMAFIDGWRPRKEDCT